MEVTFTNNENKSILKVQVVMDKLKLVYKEEESSSYTVDGIRVVSMKLKISKKGLLRLSRPFIPIVTSRSIILSSKLLCH